MKLSQNFSLSEFTASQTARRHMINNTIPNEYMSNARFTAQWLQLLRDRLNEHYGRKISIAITSGFRCIKLNKKLGGSKTSSHCKALAVDIVAHGISVKELFDFIRTHMRDEPFDQVIFEFGEWVHVGLEVKKSRPRGQVLEAYKVKNLLGKIKTEYKYVDALYFSAIKTGT